MSCRIVSYVSGSVRGTIGAWQRVTVQRCVTHRRGGCEQLGLGYVFRFSLELGVSWVFTMIRIILICLCLCVSSSADFFANKNESSDLILTHIVSTCVKTICAPVLGSVSARHVSGGDSIGIFSSPTPPPLGNFLQAAIS